MSYKVLLLLFIRLFNYLNVFGQRETKLVAAGTAYGGNIFAFNSSDGSDLERWVDLSWGEHVNGELLKSNGKFWGTAQRGGSNGLGLFFSLNLDGFRLHASTRL